MKKLLFVTTILMFIAGCSPYSDGKRQGEIVKLSHRGFICKTWEGELATLSAQNRGAYNGLAISNTFYFSVTDKAVLDKLQIALDTGKRVSISYEEVYFRFPCEADTQYDIVDVKIIN